MNVIYTGWAEMQLSDGITQQNTLAAFRTGLPETEIIHIAGALCRHDPGSFGFDGIDTTNTPFPSFSTSWPAQRDTELRATEILHIICAFSRVLAAGLLDQWTKVQGVG